jgi:hypothetical protein
MYKFLRTGKKQPKPENQHHRFNAEQSSKNVEQPNQTASASIDSSALNQPLQQRNDTTSNTNFRPTSLIQIKSNYIPNNRTNLLINKPRSRTIDSCELEKKVSQLNNFSLFKKKVLHLRESLFVQKKDIYLKRKFNLFLFACQIKVKNNLKCYFFTKRKFEILNDFRMTGSLKF